MYLLLLKLSEEECTDFVEGDGADRMNNALMVRDISVRKFGDDILLEGYI